ncbi:uncharacterized protein PAC_14034 [Phialocephala subalpina]|uniref:CorA-like transporter domain-containing protein n=1 Tax=Phialocephala subalpina TaxID=576137 RepID=A0A1L7XGR5_9HELO|nr:uncharacterized protein PAC_14034 [Phialocephala subalpina]
MVRSIIVCFSFFVSPQVLSSLTSTEQLFSFIRQKNSNSRLLINDHLFTALIESNNIFDEFEDFVLSFGWKQREYDVGPPPCRFSVGSPSGRYRTFGIEPIIHFFGTFADPIECAYGLRYVELNNHGNQKEPWSVRQTGIYHKFEGSTEIWVFISPSPLIESKAVEHIDQIKEKCIKGVNPFELHLKLIIASLSNFRWYIKSLVERAAEQSIRVVAAQVGQGKLSSLIDFEINFEDRQLLKVVEDLALDLITIFDSTTDTINAIIWEYEYICDESGHRSDNIMSGLRDCLREVDLYMKKTKTLCKRIQGTASLLSDLLDYENAKIAQENGESLRILAQESREENSTMRALTEKGTKDAAAVKVITLITIIFLPTTVVSGFFSTQFVRQSEDGTRLTLTANWWIIAAISIPLTVVTFTIWYCWVRFPWNKWWDERIIRRSRKSNIIQRRPTGLGANIDPPNTDCESAFRDSPADGNSLSAARALHYSNTIGSKSRSGSHEKF